MTLTSIGARSSGMISRSFLRSFKLIAKISRNAVDNPVLILSTLDQPLLSQLRELLGNRDLSCAHHSLQMRDTQRTVTQQIHNTQSLLIAQQGKNVRKFHLTFLRPSRNGWFSEHHGDLFSQTIQLF